MIHRGSAVKDMSLSTPKNITNSESQRCQTHLFLGCSCDPLKLLLIIFFLSLKSFRRDFFTGTNRIIIKVSFDISLGFFFF